MVSVSHFLALVSYRVADLFISLQPFSCFSPSYHETLPPRQQQTNARAAIPQFSNNGLPPAPPSPSAYQRSRGKSVDFAAGSGQGGAGPGATALSAKVSRRRSAGPGGGGRRISKDLIGAPTNFTHVGGHGTPAAAAGGPEVSSFAESSTELSLEAPRR